MKKNKIYPQMPVKKTFLYGRLISGKSLGDVIYVKARRKYCFRLLLVFESGDVKMVQRTASSNKQLARQERDEALMEIAKGSFIPFSYTVKEFYDFWFYHYMIGQKRITYNTYNAYRNIIENYLLPAIGHKMLNTLQRKDLVNALSAIPYQKVQRTAIGVVTGSLCYAQKHNYLSRDIYTGISSEVKQPCLKKKVDTRQQVYTVEQAAHLLYLCKQQEPMIYLPMLLAVTAGLRISEITGLRYSDIDFLGRKLFVERQLGKNLYIEKEQENRPVLCSELPLKTKNSKRAVVLADFVLDEILLERQRYEKRKASNPGFLDLGYICCHENGQCHNRSFYIKPYNRLMEQSGISRLPWRKFRNTYATILAQYQVNTKTISKCLGHSSPEFTSRVYVAFQEQETYDISKIIEDYVLTHHLLPKKQGSVEQRPYQLPDALAYRNYFYD